MKKVERKQKVKQQKLTLKNVKRKQVTRRMTVQEALKLAINNSRHLAKHINDWIKENEDSTKCVIILTVTGEDMKTHVFMEQDSGEVPFPMIMHGVPPNLDRVIEAERHELEQLMDELDPSLIQDGLTATIVSSMELQIDRRDSLLQASEKYAEVLKYENGQGSEILENQKESK